MSISGTSSTLLQTAKQLNIEWQQTKEQWNDIKSQEFEKTYLEELPGHVTRAAALIEELDNVLKRIRSECE